MISIDFIDKWLIFKELVKSKISNSCAINENPLVRRAVKELGQKKIQRVVRGWPDTVLIICEDEIIRIPFDKLSLARCQNNKRILMELCDTRISDRAPKFLKEFQIKELIYFSETKLPGFSLRAPISNIEYLTIKAAEFITEFQKETAKSIFIDRFTFERLIGNDFRMLHSYIIDNYYKKLIDLQEKLYQQLLGKSLLIVWSHGDFKIENVLFDSETWQIKGVIDWDLSIKDGLPLLDILFLLIYKTRLQTGKDVACLFKDKFLRFDFTPYEEKIISKYLKTIGLSEEMMKPLVVLFWINHLTHRCQQAFVEDLPSKKKWLSRNVYEIIDEIGMIK